MIKPEQAVSCLLGWMHLPHPAAQGCASVVSVVLLLSAAVAQGKSRHCHLSQADGRLYAQLEIMPQNGYL